MSLHKDDFDKIIFANLKKFGVAGHHIQSMNYFLGTGIRQIVTEGFEIEGNIVNQRSATDEDRKIGDIRYKLSFTDIRLTPPKTTKFKSGQETALYPNMARKGNLNYAASAELDVRVEITAYHKNGTVYEEKKPIDIKKINIGQIPICVGCDLCNTRLASAEILRRIEEDPSDHGGYFILSGTEWSIDSLENTRNNAFNCYHETYKKEIARCTFISKPGDAFENSYQIAIRMLNNGAITFELTQNKFSALEIPFYMIYRVFGMSLDEDIANSIVYGLENDDPVSAYIKKKISEAFFADVPPEFASVANERQASPILSVLASLSYKNVDRSDMLSNKNIERGLIERTMKTFDSYILPHIGKRPEDRIEKLHYISLMINKLIRVEMGVLEPTNRDSYANKRLHPAGISMAKAFKTQFNFAVVQRINRQISKELESSSFSMLKIEDSIRSLIDDNTLANSLGKSIKTGDKSFTVYNTEIQNRVSSQQLDRKSDLNIISQARIVNTRNPGSNKQSDRADEMRRVHSTYTGYICVTQSKDTGEGVGKIKQLASGCTISTASNSNSIKEFLYKHEDIIAKDKVTPNMVSKDKLSFVFVNGDIVGYCKNQFLLADKLREIRRNDKILRPDISINTPITLRELHIWCDYGRVLVPRIVVYNNVAEFNEKAKAGKPIKFEQYIKLTAKHLEQLDRDEITIDTLREQGIIEYISAEESEDLYVAESYAVFEKHKNNELHQFTHVEIEQAVIGIVALAAPLVTHSNGVRNTFFTNHRKQTAGWYSLNYPFRIDKNTFIQYRCDYPMISSFTDKITKPNGQNATVALMIYNGFNQEDSIIVNKTARDRGLFNGSFFNNEYDSIEDSGDQFGLSDITQTKNIKRDAVYEKLDANGLVKVGSKVKKNDVLIAKFNTLNKPDGNYRYADKSTVYKHPGEAYVEQAIEMENYDNIDGKPIRKVKLRTPMNIIMGDKLSSENGNKGIVSQVIPAQEMPFTEDGTTPDLIVNPHSIPSRKAVSQMIQCLMSQWCAKKGHLIENTAFKNNDLMKYVNELHEMGFEWGGVHKMYNGKTGEAHDCLIFNGITTYQRLQKFVINEHYAISTGPTNAQTRQPLQGKSKDGGLRMGEMEKDIMGIHGSMISLREKYMNHSDGNIMYVCRKCGQVVSINKKTHNYKCLTPSCGESSDIVAIHGSWSSNLFYNELKGMGINTKFGVD